MASEKRQTSSSGMERKRRSEQRTARRVATRWVDYLLWNNQYGGEDWYPKAREAIRAKYGDDATLFCDILAATSPQTDVVRNVQFAEEAYSRHKKGLPVTGWLPNHRINLQRLRDGLPLGGPKVVAFAAALRGDDDAVVVDTWMLRAAGMGKRLHTNRAFRVAYDAIRFTSEWTGQPCTTCQAVVWMNYRATNWTSKKGKGDGYLPI